MKRKLKTFYYFSQTFSFHFISFIGLFRYLQFYFLTGHLQIAKASLSIFQTFSRSGKSLGKFQFIYCQFLSAGTLITACCKVKVPHNRCLTVVYCERLNSLTDDVRLSLWIMNIFKRTAFHDIFFTNMVQCGSKNGIVKNT